MVSDQHNAKFFGYRGHPDVLTPSLDRMASEGVRCDNAITQNPICTPSRVSFLSGQYPHNHGYYGLSGPNPPGLPNVLGHFKSFGYLSAAIGKIHCPENWVEDACDVFCDTTAVSVGGRSEEYIEFLNSRGVLEIEDHKAMNEFGGRGNQSQDSRPSKLKFDECQDGWIADKTIATIKQANKADTPFIIHASFPRPHQCTSPCQEFWDLYEGRSLHLPPNADWNLELKAPNLQFKAKHWRTGNWPLIEPRDFKHGRMRKLRGYLGAISQVDAAAGKILDYLRSSGLEENTIVVFIADHGEFAGEHGILEKNPGISSDAVSRVPMIWWGGKNLKPGHVVRQIVELVDIPNTFCHQAGIEQMETCDGINISNQLSGETVTFARLGVTEFAWSKSVRKNQYRYIHYQPDMFKKAYPNGFGELYNLNKDPWEMHNLYFDPSYQEIVRSMQADLLNWIIRTNRPTTSLFANNANKNYPINDQRKEAFHAIVNSDNKFNPNILHFMRGSNYL